MRSLLLLLAAGVTLSAARITGNVTDANTGEPLARVAVQLSGTEYQAVSGSQGQFSRDGIPPGEYTLQIATVGYRPLKQKFSLGEGEVKTFEIALQPDTLRQSVEVSAGAFGHETPTAVALAGNELRNLASVLTDDPLRAVQSLPGVTSNDDFQAQITLRGAGFDRVGIYLDGVLLHAPFHTLQGDATSASVTAFNGDMLDSVNLHAGAPPVLFADRSAGVVDIRTRDGDRKRFSGRATASASNAGFLLEGPIGTQRRGSWLAGARKSYLQYIIDLTSDEDSVAFGFTDVEGKISYDLAPKHTLSASVVDAYSGLDRTGITRPGLNTVIDSGYHFTVAQVASRYAPAASFLLTNRIALLRERFENRNRDGLVLARNQGFGEWVWSADATRVWRGSSTLDAGWTLRKQRDDGGFNRLLGVPVTVQRLDEYRGTGLRAGGYARQTWTGRGGKLAAAVGLRFDRHSVNAVNAASPFASVGIQLLPSTRFDAAWGQYVQFPEISQFYSLDGRRTLLPARATHYLASLEQRLGGRTRLRVEAYSRQDRDLLFHPYFEPRILNGLVYTPPARTPLLNSQRGYARGVQIFLQRRTANSFTGWASYAYGTTQVRDGATQLAFPADYDQRHTVTLFGGYRLRPTVNLSAKVLYGSGIPVRGFFRTVAGAAFLAADRNQVRLPDYKRADLRINKAFIKDRWQMTLFAEVVNLLNRNNYRFDDLSGYDVRTGSARIRLEKMFPVLPSAGLLIEF